MCVKCACESNMRVITHPILKSRMVDMWTKSGQTGRHSRFGFETPYSAQVTATCSINTAPFQQGVTCFLVREIRYLLAEDV